MVPGAVSYDDGGELMHPVLILTKNNLTLTKRCVESVRKQSVDTSIHIYDNQSVDGTQEWISKQDDIIDQSSGVDLGVSAGWNFVLEILFEPQREREGHKTQGWGADYVLVINNDTILPTYFYAELLSYNVSFVTGYSTEDAREIGPLFHHERRPLIVAPDFSAYLIRKEAWDKVGPFNNRMKLYAGDNDWAVRAHRAGVPLYRANTPFYHERSSTLKKASPAERREIQLQADADREVFKSIYGCMPWEPGYAELFK
jgi:GT2 family glycosyltransferase